LQSFQQQIQLCDSRLTLLQTGHADTSQLRQRADRLAELLHQPAKLDIERFRQAVNNLRADISAQEQRILQIEAEAAHQRLQQPTAAAPAPQKPARVKPAPAFDASAYSFFDVGSLHLGSFTPDTEARQQRKRNTAPPAPAAAPQTKRQRVAAQPQPSFGLVPSARPEEHAAVIPPPLPVEVSEGPAEWLRDLDSDGISDLLESRSSD
jgi:hypothetical protein